MMKGSWDKLTVIQKRVTMLAALVAGLVSIGGVAWAGASVVATDYEVDAKILLVQNTFDNYTAEQEVKDKEKAIREARWRLEDVEYRLLNPDLPDVQKAALQQSKAKLLRRIKCIQAKQAFCD